MLESDSRYETVHLKIQSRHTRTEMDTSSTAALHKVSSEIPPLDSAPSLPPSRYTDPVYTEAVTAPGSRKVTQLPLLKGWFMTTLKPFRIKMYSILG